MNLIIHQFKTDWRHFHGGLLALWALFGAQLFLAGANIDLQLTQILQLLLLFLESLAGAFLLAPLIQADALVGSSAQWLTRPVRRRHLFWSKTAFILMGVVLPWLVPQMVVYELHYYTFDLFVAGLAMMLLKALAVVLFIAALAALTPDLPRFFRALGIALAGFFLWAFLLSDWFRHAAPQPASQRASGIVVALLFFCLCTALAWVWQFFSGRTVVGFRIFGFGLLALPWMLYSGSNDFLAPHTQPLPLLAISAVNETNLDSDHSEGQPLWGKFQVNGLPDHDVVVAEDVVANFNPQGQWKTYSLPPFRLPMNVYSINHGRDTAFDRVLPMDSPQQTDYLKVIHEFFPPETLWAGRQGNIWSGFPETGDLFKKITNRPAIGGFYARVELDEFRVTPVAQLPLRAGTWNLGPGKMLVIQKITPQQNGVQLEVQEIQAAPMVDRTEYLFASGFGLAHDAYTFVLYQPDWGEADVLDSHQFSYTTPDVLYGETRQVIRFVLPYPVLQERLAGASLQDFLKEARLCVFRPVYQGTIKQSLQENNFNLFQVNSLSPVHSPSVSRSGDQKDLQIIDAMTLPKSPTVAQMNDYLDAILLHPPAQPGNSEKRKIQARLKALGTPGIPLLLARLPLDGRTERDYIFPVLTKLAAREQLPELRAALGRDMQLADWFHEMKWDDDARDIVIGKLGDHRIPFSASALVMAAEARDPATYSDLAWHFVHLPYQQDVVAEALAKCPGFDLSAAVRQAWLRVQLWLNPPGDLAVVAAREGLPDAFNRAVIGLENNGEYVVDQQNKAWQIATLTDFSGSPETALAWLSANLGHFHYDAVSHRYQVEGE